MQYPKLFEHSEINYITPFLRLWMSFNNWYNIELNKNSDRSAINACKKLSTFQRKFNKLFEDRNKFTEDEDTLKSKHFTHSLENFAIAITKTKWPKLKYPSNLFYERLDSDDEKTLQQQLLIPISENKRYYISDSDVDRLFKQTIENIYVIRNQVVHGNFDISEIKYRYLVENCYKILHPILDALFQDTRKNTYICKNKEGTEAYGKYIPDGNNMIVLEGSKICIFCSNSVSNKTLKDRKSLLESNSILKEGYHLLTKRIRFNSPSRASSFCLGMSSNGLTAWKNEDGMTVKSTP